VGSPVISRLLDQYGCGPVHFAGIHDALYQRHLLFDDVVAPAAAGLRERFEAFARSVRDILSQRWVLTEETYKRPASDVSIQISTAGYEVFLFGLTADQVAASRSWSNPRWHYENEAETRAALDLIFSNYFSPNEPGLFEPLQETLLTGGDYYMHVADLKSYVQAQERLGDLHANQDAWARKAILNVASSGKFSSDRTIAEYASDIWGVSPCPVQ
jgi:hypothetical protein